MRIGAIIARNLRTQEMPAAQGFLAILTFSNVDALTTSRNAARSSSRVLAQSAQRARRLVRQHFLKRDDVFFRRVGVFGMECISIPECTQRTKPSHISEGNMAKKAKKAKKAKSAVKKTAKKTRKVAKKKK